jgi:hypothetical protein
LNRFGNWKNISLSLSLSAQPILPFFFSLRSPDNFSPARSPRPVSLAPAQLAAQFAPAFPSLLSLTRGTRPSSPSSGRVGTPSRVRAPLPAPSDSAWPARQGPAPCYKSNAPRPLEPKTQSRSRRFRQTLASAPSPLLELGAPSCVAVPSRPRRLRAFQKFRVEAVMLADLFFSLYLVFSRAH